MKLQASNNYDVKQVIKHHFDNPSDLYIGNCHIYMNGKYYKMERETEDVVEISPLLSWKVVKDEDSDSCESACDKEE